MTKVFQNVFLVCFSPDQCNFWWIFFFWQNFWNIKQIMLFSPQAIHSLFQSIECTDIFLHQSVDDATLGWNIPRYHGWIFKRSSRNMPCYSNSTNYKWLSFIHNAHNGPISSRVIWVWEAVYDPKCYYSVMWNGCKESFHICFPIDFLSGLRKASCSR